MTAEPTTDAIRATRTLAAYLSAFADPDGGSAALAAFAPDALVLHGGVPVRADAVDAAGYAAAHKAAAAADGFPAGEPVLQRFDAEQSLGWFDVAGLRLAAGFAADRLAWVALVPEGDVTFARGRALAVAEAPFVAGLPAHPYRGFLDVAHRRRFHAPKPELAALPDARFACAGSADCCQMAWEVVVPASAQTILDALPYAEFAPELAGTQLTPREDGQLYLKQRHETCRFLDEQRRCRIHATLGTPIFTPCVTFPLRFTETPDGLDVTASFSCGTARGGFGPPIVARAADAWERYAQSGPTVRARPRLRKDEETDWATYRAAEADLLGALRMHALPLHRRLWIGSRLLAARLEPGKPADVDHFGLEPLAPLDADEKQFIEIYLGYPLSVLGMLDDALAPGTSGRVSVRRLPDEARVAHWFENIVFAKDYPTEFGLVTTNALLVLLYGFLSALDAARDGEPLEPGTWRTLATAIDHRIFMDGGLKPLLNLVPVLANNLDHPHAALVMLRHFHHAAREAAFAT